MLQGCRLFKQCLKCRLFKQCWNLPAGHCVAVVQAVKAVLEQSCRALCCRGTGCLSGVRTYLPCTVCRGAGCLSGVGTYLRGSVLQGCRLLKWCPNYLPGTVCRCAGCLSSVVTYLQGMVLQGSKLLKPCRNLPARHCVAGVQAL